uniref:Fibronectin type-III domain-containing protein n=5 Tax=Ciona intestinalis TaxID=7719 RepID=F6Z1P6_CIOIN
MLHKLQNEQRILVDQTIQARRFATYTNLESGTRYFVTVYPSTISGIIIPGAVGRASTTTLESTELVSRNTTISTTITSVGPHHVTLSWQRRAGVANSLIFFLRMGGMPAILQRKLVSRYHSSITFQSLRPDTNYLITAHSLLNTTLLLRASVTTSRRIPSLEEAITDNYDRSLVPPTGLVVLSSTTESVLLQWNLVAPGLQYNVRLYKAGTNVLSVFRQKIRQTQITMSQLRPGRYEATVSSYDPLSKEESSESPRVSVNL